MSMTRFRKDAYDMGISVARLKSLAAPGTPTTVANITNPDATDQATAITLTNANKAKINALLTALRAKGLIG